MAVDIIGEPGKSAGTRPSYKSDGHAQWLKEVFTALDVHQAALCGLSLGGMLAYKFALLYPESVSSLALLAPPLSNARFSVMYRAILANVIPTSFFAKKFLNYISASASQWPAWGIKAFVAPYQSYKFNLDPVPVITDHELSQLPPKTLILIGQDEVLCNPETVASRIHSVAPSIILDILPGAKHTISTDQPALVNEKLLHFTCALIETS